MRNAALCLLIATAIAAHCGPLVTAYRAAQPPRLDGSLDDACWQQSLTAGPFISAQGKGMPEVQTQARLCWDAGSLYLGVEAFEPLLDPRLNMLHLVKADQSGRDANVFSDDCIEVFLQVPGGEYYHLAANSGDATYEARGTDDAWNCEWHCTARRGERSYVLEMQIPFAALGAGPEGAWRLNVARFRANTREYSTWSGLQGAFHQPSAFGSLSFAAAGPSLGGVQTSVTADAAELRAQVGGAADAATHLELAVAAGGKGTGRGADGPGAKTLSVPLPPEATGAGRADLVYSLKQGNLLLAQSAPIPVTIAAAAADFLVRSTGAATQAFLNGEAVDLTEGSARLRLKTGLNVIAVQAQAQGDAPSVQATVSSGGRVLPISWLVRADAPGENWRTVFSSEGWERGAQGADGLWSGAGKPDAFLLAGVYVGAPGPPLFPKQDTFYVPRGSRQLAGWYVQVPSDVPADDYCVVVEVPDGLEYVAADPLGSGQAPAVSAAGHVEAEGQRLTRYEGAYGALPGQGMELSIRWGDAAGGLVGYEPSITAGGTLGWRRLTAEVRPPKVAASARPLVVKWQDRGIVGTFWVDNVVMREKGSDENLLKMGTFEEPEWGRHSMIVPEGADGGKCLKIVSTAETANRQQAMWVDKDASVAVDPDKEYVVELDVRCERVGSPNARPLLGLLFGAPEAMPESDGPMYTYFQCLGGAITSLPRRATVRVLPPLKDRRPARARIAPCYYSSRFQSPQVARAFSDNCQASGITWTYGGAGNDVVAPLLPLGHQVILSIPWEPWGAPPGAAKLLEDSPDLAAVDFKGTRSIHTFCPTWVLTEGQAVMDALEAWLLKMVNQSPCFGANWDLEQPVVDPPTFCTCPRCIEAFRAFAGIPAGEQITRETLLAAHRDRWVEFRCTQNAEMAGRLRAILRKADRPVEFSLYSGYQSKRTREHYGVDWKLMAPHLDYAIAGYGGEREVVTATRLAVGDVPFMGGEMWYLSDRSDEEPTPRMETWRNRILRQFVDSGCHGCLIWWLPPMDGGAFYATSEAAALIAQHEDLLTQANRCDEQVRVTGIEARNWAAFSADGEIRVLLLNFAPETRKVTLVAGGKTRECTVEPYGFALVNVGP